MRFYFNAWKSILWQFFHGLGTYSRWAFRRQGLKNPKSRWRALAWRIENLTRPFREIPKHYHYFVTIGNMVRRGEEPPAPPQSPYLRQYGEYLFDEDLARAKASKGDPIAQWALATGFYGMDDPEGHAWILKAAMQGFPKALFALGTIHLKGWGVETDPVTACKWYRLAMRARDQDAKRHIHIAEKNMDQGEILQAMREAADMAEQIPMTVFDTSWH